MEKAPDAYRTISEVAEDLDLPQHVLRFWETRFSTIRPLKRGGGRRYYRPDDVALLRGIKHLLYGEGYTIKGVQRILKEQGPRFVMTVWRTDEVPANPPPARADDYAPRPGRVEPSLQPAPRATARDPDPVEEEEPEAFEDLPWADDEPADEIRPAAHRAVPDEHFDEDDEPLEAPQPARPMPPRAEAPRPLMAPRQLIAQRAEPAREEPSAGPGRVGPPDLGSRVIPLPIVERHEEAPATGRPAAVANFAPKPPAAPEERGPAPAVEGMSRENRRRLQAMLYELMECKRLLEGARSA